MAGILESSDIKRIASYKKKIANDFQRARDIIDVLDLSAGDYRDWTEIDKANVNYDLYNGRLDVKLYDDPVCLNIQGEKINFEFQSITHYPLISQVANSMYGEMISRPFNPIVKDNGTLAHTLRKKKWNELLKEMLNENIFQPIQNQITQAYFAQNGIQDLSRLNPQQQQQAQQDIMAQTSAKTPKEVLDFMQNDFQTPTQRQVQQLLDFLLEYQDIRSKQQEGFKHAIITGKEVYYVGDEHDEPIMELINNKYFQWQGSRDTEWIQDASWCKYERWLTIEDAIQKYSEDLSRSDIEKLLGFAEPIGGIRHYGDPKKDFVQNRTMYELSVEDGYIAKKYKDLDYKTKKGQNDYMNLYAELIRKYGAQYGEALSKFGIREVHVCWRDFRIMKRITSIIDGREVKHWQDEHYEPRPEDIKVVEVKVNEIWEGSKIGGTGGGDTLYKKIRPIPGQFKSIFNPYGVKMPYVGKAYNVHMNNAKNVSIIDLGKPWQKEFDITMTLLKHDMATNIGTVFMMSLDMKPEGWGWQDWFNVMRNGKILMTNFKKHGYNFDPGLLKEVSLSKVSDINQKIEYLNLVRQELVLSMNSNPTRMGAIGQYSTNENIVSSQSASYNQTEGYFETHRKIVEHALNMFINRARLLYKKNNKRHIIFDDVTRTELEMQPDIWSEEWGVEITTSTDDIRRMEELRNNVLTFLQNGMGHDTVIKLLFAKNPGEILQVVQEDAKKQEQRMQQQVEMEKQQRQQELETQMAITQMNQQFELEKQDRMLRSQEVRTEVDSKKFMLQNDVDMNRIPDSVQKSHVDNISKERIEAAKLALEREKLNLDSRRSAEERRLAREELSMGKDKMKQDKELKEKEIKARKPPARKPNK